MVLWKTGQKMMSGCRADLKAKGSFQDQISMGKLGLICIFIFDPVKQETNDCKSTIFTHFQSILNPTEDLEICPIF